MRIVIARVGLTITTLAIVLITMWPNPVDEGMGSVVARILELLHGLGVPDSFGYDALEFTANIIMFLPFGFFLGLLVPSRRILSLALVVAFTACIETTQFFFIAGRFGTIPDVFANTTGGWIGLLLAWGCYAFTRRCVVRRSARD